MSYCFLNAVMIRSETMKKNISLTATISYCPKNSKTGAHLMPNSLFNMKIKSYLMNIKNMF